MGLRGTLGTPSTSRVPPPLSPDSDFPKLIYPGSIHVGKGHLYWQRMVWVLDVSERFEGLGRNDALMWLAHLP